MKKSIVRGMAGLLAALLVIPTNALPAKAAEGTEVVAAENEAAVAQVTCNPGAGYFTVYDWSSVSGNDAILAEMGLDATDAEDVALFQQFFTFDENDFYTIQVEKDAFFPYEVEFTVNGEKLTKWFQSPESVVEVGGHTFGIESEVTGEQITGMTLNVAGESLVVYPEKEFVEEPLSLTEPVSLLPLKEKRLAQLDLSSYTPVELTKVSVSALLGSENVTAEKLAWKYTSSYQDDGSYELMGTADAIDLSWEAYYATRVSLQLIDNNGQQLNGEATRYTLPIKVTGSRKWLEATAYKKAADGSTVALNCYDESYSSYKGSLKRYLDVYLDNKAVNLEESVYLKLNVNSTVFANVNYSTLKAFKGEDKSVDITEQLLTPGTEGYACPLYEYQDIILEAYDAGGQVLGTLPMQLYLGRKTVTEIADYRRLYTEAGYSCTYSSSSRTNINETTGIPVVTVNVELNTGYEANTICYWKPSYMREDVKNNSYVTAAFVGSYASIAEAATAGATDIKDTLFGTKGYGADYSGDGVTFSIFVGADGAVGQEIYHYTIKATKNSSNSENSGNTGNGGNTGNTGNTGTVLNSGTFMYISDLCGENGNYIHAAEAEDSYGESNYITYYVDKTVDLSKLKLEFSLSSGAKLYAGATEVESEKTVLDFSNGPVQLTVIAEDGENSKNYWVAVYKPVEGAGQLYINSLNDGTSGTEVRNGVVYSTREVMLDYIHNDVHDIIVTNLGTEPIANLKVELSADATVALDEYWRLDGQYSLEGFSDSYGYTKDENGSFTSNTTSDGVLWNMCKVRLVKKDGVEDGTDVTGTLTFKSGETTLVVLTLTGTVGDPTIVTKEIPAAVKYVPYGVVIQNSNKYSWNKITYEKRSGSLPAGMVIKSNGEIYGVPTETGEFTFKVRMRNSSGRFKNNYVDKEFTLTVGESTDVNVDAATDTGYEVLDRIPDLDWEAEGNYSIRSNGAFSTFQDIYLDGVKLVEGVDYTKSEGSTRVTISSQTLKSSRVAGAHTLGMEFREGATELTEGSLKKAAQNYYLGDEDEYERPNQGNTGNSGKHDDDDDDDDDAEESAAVGQNGENEATGSGNGTAPQYTVVKGDTLSRIAARNNMTLAALIQLNPQISNPNLIRIGQVIYLGNGVASVTATDISQEVVGFHTIVKGDCLYTIARKYKLSLANLLALNPQIAGQKYIYPNQRIRVK